jgi:hypothetical protein
VLNGSSLISGVCVILRNMLHAEGQNAASVIQRLNLYDTDSEFKGIYLK